MDEYKDIKVGDTVSFDIEGVDKSPFGYGKVTSKSSRGILIRPDHQVTFSMKMINIKKVG